MKKLLIAFVGMAFLTACGNHVEIPNTEKTPSENDIAIEIQEESSDEETVVSAELLKNEYVLNTEKSKFFWKGITPVKSHEGTINIESGSIKKTDDKITGAFVVDMTSIKVTDIKGPGAQGLVDHLENEDFFDVPNFPKSKFEITQSEKINDSSYSITGDLTIKGITNPVSFEMQFEEKDSLAVLSDFNIDRTLWDIRYGSGKFFENLGDKIINDEIEIKLELEFQ